MSKYQETCLVFSIIYDDYPDGNYAVKQHGYIDNFMNLINLTGFKDFDNRETCDISQYNDIENFEYNYKDLTDEFNNTKLVWLEKYNEGNGIELLICMSEKLEISSSRRNYNYGKFEEDIDIILHQWKLFKRNLKLKQIGI